MAASEGTETSLLDVVDLKKYFPIRGGLLKRQVGAVKAVDGISFYIKRGETLGLVGESGCGKTTVGRSIMMLTPPTAGYVFLETPREVVNAFRALLHKVEAIEPGIMTALDADGIAQATKALLRLHSCDVAEDKKNHLCEDADKIHKLTSRYAGTDHVKEEDDIRDFFEESIKEVAKKHCINFKKKKQIRRLRSRIQFVFQDPFSSLDPKMLIRDIVAEPITAQNRYRKRRVKEPALPPGRTPAGSRTAAEMSRDHSVKAQGAATGSKNLVRLRESQKRMKRGEIRNYTIAMLEKVGLNVEHMYRFPHEFSGGQRQRIGIARALSVDPDFVVLDEPTSALDVSVQAQILNQLNALQHDLGLTYLFISHDLSVVRYMCDRVAVMYLGKIVEYASKDNLFARPTHPYTEALLSVIPVPDPDLRRDRIILPGDVPSPANPPSGCRFHTRCPLVIDICRSIDPPLMDRGDEHYVACHVR